MKLLLKKYLLAATKIGVSAALLAFLFYQASQNESFRVLRDQPKQWPLLVVGASLTFAAVCVTIFRWWLLVRALETPFHWRDALRLGFLGYLFNFFTLGVMGGDLVRMVFIARHCSAKRAEAAATVVIDRMFGIFGLVVVVSLAYLMVDVQAMASSSEEQLAAVRVMGRTSMILSACGGVAVCVFLLPGFTTSPLWETLARIPKIGGFIERTVSALRLYRRKAYLLVIALLLSMGVHTLMACGVFFIAQGLSGNAPGLNAHLLVVPLAMLAGALPVPGGLGAFETALNLLYQAVLPSGASKSLGFVVALGFRMVTILVAMIGLGYYLADRGGVKNLLREVEEDQQTPND